MRNVIRMDFYRLFRTKAIKVGIIASVVAALLGMLFSMGILEIVKMAFETGDPETAEGLGILVSSAGWINGVDYADVVLSGTSTLSLFIACMVVASFIGTEQSSGYLKNVIGQLPNRGYMVGSKFVVTSCIHLIILAVYTLVSCVFANVFFGSYINAWSIGDLVLALCLRALLYIAFNSIIIFLCMLTKSSSLAMVIGAIFGIGVTRIAYPIIAMITGKMGVEIDLSLYTPDGLNSMLSAAEVGDHVVRSLIVFAAFVVVFVGLAVMLVKKRDVK